MKIHIDSPYTTNGNHSTFLRTPYNTEKDKYITVKELAFSELSG